MAEVAFAKQAEFDLEDIDGFSVDRFGATTAEAYMRGFEAAFALLAEHPEAGPATPRYGKGLRCLIHREHRIFYRLEGQIVLVIRIIHHARYAGTVFRVRRP